MNRILDEWIFINFCGQKIGQFNTQYIKSGLINALSVQITNILYIPLFICYISVGFRTFLPLIILVIVLAVIANYTLKHLTKHRINLGELEKRYRATSKNTHITNFILSILMVAGSFLIFCFSLALLKYFI